MLVGRLSLGRIDSFHARTREPPVRFHGYAPCRDVRGNIMHQEVRGASPDINRNPGRGSRPKPRTGEVFSVSGLFW